MRHFYVKHTYENNNHQRVSLAAVSLRLIWKGCQVTGRRLKKKQYIQKNLVLKLAFFYIYVFVSRFHFVVLFFLPILNFNMSVTFSFDVISLELLCRMRMITIDRNISWHRKNKTLSSVSVGWVVKINVSKVKWIVCPCFPYFPSLLFLCAQVYMPKSQKEFL